MTRHRLIGSADACARLGIVRSTLTRMVKTGRLTPIDRLPGESGAFLFDPVAVEALAAERGA